MKAAFKICAGGKGGSPQLSISNAMGLHTSQAKQEDEVPCRCNVLSARGTSNRRVHRHLSTPKAS
jgi:hypothetical protein